MSSLALRQHGVVTRAQLLAIGFSTRTIERRLASGWFHQIHRGVYAMGRMRLDQPGHWLAAVLACGEEALLSHRSAVALWGLTRQRGTRVDVTSPHGRRGRRAGIALHRGKVDIEDRAVHDAVPVTTVARTLFDLAEVVDPHRLEHVFEEADRLNMLELQALERICERNPGRRALRPVRRLIASARAPTTTRSPLEGEFAAFCRTHRLPFPAFNTMVLGYEVDALWPAQRLVVELDGFSFHRHRAAFERDRARDAALQAAGYRAIRLTHRRLENDGPAVAVQLRRLLATQPNSTN